LAETGEAQAAPVSPARTSLSAPPPRVRVCFHRTRAGLTTTSHRIGVARLREACVSTACNTLHISATVRCSGTETSSRWLANREIRVCGTFCATHKSGCHAGSSKHVLRWCSRRSGGTAAD
jgi:hypothetical protein